jgi:3-phytase
VSNFSLIALWAFAGLLTPEAAVPISATVETVPTSNARDSADDPAIWIHPTDPSLSTIIGTDKKGALEVYDLSGARLQSISVTTNNVDLRYNFPLGGERVALVTAFDKVGRHLVAYKVDPATRQLVDVLDANMPKVGGGGASMYRSPVTGKYYYLANQNGTLRQYELFDNGSGRVSVALVRTVQYGHGESEAVTADDVHAYIYVSLEQKALWRLGAEPDSTVAQTLVDTTIAKGGHLEPDIEGLAIYYKSDGTGYLFASSQGDNTYTVYTREGDNAYLGTFAIVDGVIDGTSSTDGIDVTNFPLGPGFPMGVFVAQDGWNADAAGSRQNHNFKLVPFESLTAGLNLTADTSWDPRQVGATAVPVASSP